MAPLWILAFIVVPLIAVTGAVVMVDASKFFVRRRRLALLVLLLALWTAYCGWTVRTEIQHAQYCAAEVRTDIEIYTSPCVPHVLDSHEFLAAVRLAGCSPFDDIHAPKGYNFGATKLSRIFGWPWAALRTLEGPASPHRAAAEWLRGSWGGERLGGRRSAPPSRPRLRT
jgi:hypothetical protein